MVHIIEYNKELQNKVNSLRRQLAQLETEDPLLQTPQSGRDGRKTDQQRGNLEASVKFEFYFRSLMSTVQTINIFWHCIFLIACTDKKENKKRYASKLATL